MARSVLIYGAAWTPRAVIGISVIEIDDWQRTDVLRALEQP